MGAKKRVATKRVSIIAVACLVAISLFGARVRYNIPGINVLDDLKDVAITDPKTGETIIWDGVKWASDSVGGSAFADSARVSGYADSSRTCVNPFPVSDSVDGLFIGDLENTSSAVASVVGAIYTVTNDNGYWGGIGMTGSGSTIGSGAFVNTLHLYNQGYNDMIITNDGNVDFAWYSDTLDAHNFGALNNEIMTLTPAGSLYVRKLKLSDLTAIYSDTVLTIDGAGNVGWTLADSIGGGSTLLSYAENGTFADNQYATGANSVAIAE